MLRLTPACRQAGGVERIIISNILQDTYKKIVKSLKKIRYPSPVYTDPLYRLAKGTDAGFYRLIPRVVVQVNCEQEVITVLNICRDAGIPGHF